MSASSRSLLVVCTSSPYRSTRARDGLDLVLTAAAFEVPVTLFFCGDGIYQLLAQQQAGLIGHKDLSATLPVLPLYDVERIYVAEQDLQARGIDPASLLLPAEPLTAADAAALFHQHDQILSF